MAWNRLDCYVTLHVVSSVCGQAMRKSPLSSLSHFLSPACSHCAVLLSPCKCISKNLRSHLTYCLNVTLFHPKIRYCYYVTWYKAISLYCVFKHSLYLESVLQLHHAAVEEGRRELRRDTKNFGGGLTGFSRNRLSCPKQDVICVHFPLWLSNKGLLLTQVEFGYYRMCCIIEHFHRDSHCLTCVCLEKTHIIYVSVNKIKKIYSVRHQFTLL